MITLEKLLNELKPDSLNEIVAGLRDSGGSAGDPGNKGTVTIKTNNSSKSNKSNKRHWRDGCGYSAFGKCWFPGVN